jgi:hypothetical protein
VSRLQPTSEPIVYSATFRTEKSTASIKLAVRRTVAVTH